MRWKYERPPQEGDERIFKRFALFPTVVDEEKEVVWLECYTEMQRYAISYDWTGWVTVWRKSIRKPFEDLG